MIQVPPELLRGGPVLSGTYDVVKISKRLYIQRFEDKLLVYSPPDFIRLPNRQALKDLADEFTHGRRYIDAITTFETVYSPRKTTGRHRGAPAESGEFHVSRAAPASSGAPAA